MNISIRLASAEHFEALRDIEVEAYATLLAAGAVSGPPQASGIADLRRYHMDGLLFAAFGESDVPIGFAGGCIVEGWLHVAEADVLPAWQRKGVGRALMEALLRAGRTRNLIGATLTTDRYAAFNAPFYESMGFRIAGDADRPAHLTEIVSAEAERGLDRSRRVAMVLTF